MTHEAMNSDFSIIDKLVAFGIEAASTDGMVSGMNRMLSDMQVPGSMARNQSPGHNRVNRLWYVATDGRPNGPFDEKELLAFLLDRRINKDTLAWSAGMPQWQRVEDIPEILKLLMLLPPEL